MKKRKIKIVYIVSTLLSSGPIRLLYDLVANLDLSSFDISIISLSPELKNTRLGDFQKLGFRVINFNCRHILGLFSAYMKLRKYIHEYSPDIIHSHCLRSDLLLFFSKFENKVTTCHNSDENYIWTFGNIAGRFVALLHHKIFSRLYVIACSESIRKHYLSKNISMVAIPNGIDHLHFHPLEKRKEYDEISREMAWIKDFRRIVVSSSITHGKNIAQILDALKLVKNNYHIIFLGNGDLYPMFRKKTEHDANIEFRGFVPDVLPYLQTSDIYISASRTEGLPCSVLEGLLCGNFALLSDIPAHREIVEHFPEMKNFLFPLDDPVTLAKHIEYLLEHGIPGDRKTIAQTARKYFSAEKMAKKYADFYLKIAAKTQNHQK